MTSNQTGKVPVNPEEGYGIGWSVKTGATPRGPASAASATAVLVRTAMWVDTNNGIAMIVLIERFDMTGKEQNELYRTFLKTAVAKFGKPKL